MFRKILMNTVRCKLALLLQYAVYAVPLPLVDFEMASDDTNQNNCYGACNMLLWFSTSFWPETATQSALRFSVFDCFSCARSGNQADVPLNYKQCQWSWGLLGNELAELAKKTREDSRRNGGLKKVTKLPSTMAPKHAKGDWDCTILQDFAVFFMPEAAMHSDCLVCSLCG